MKDGRERKRERERERTTAATTTSTRKLNSVNWRSFAYFRLTRNALFMTLAKAVYVLLENTDGDGDGENADKTRRREDMKMWQ